jgi:neutral ceramidase
MRFSSVLILCGVVWSFCGLSSVEADWKAGAAGVKITPEQPMWMSGYAARTGPAEGTLHDLWAKSLVLEDEAGTKAVLVTLDLVGIDRQTSQAICEAIQTRHNIPRSAIALSTSHTHTGPVVGTNLMSMYREKLSDEQQQRIVDYTKTLTQKVIGVVDEAMKNLAPAELHHGLGKAEFAVNRRNNREADVPELREKGELKGPVDHEVPVLTVKTDEGKLIAIVCGYACHATVLSFNQWSGDWPGFAQIEIEKDHPGALALFWAGCGADQNPLPRRTVELAKNYGRHLANAVGKALSTDMKPLTGKLRLHYAEIDLPLAKLPTKEELQKDTQSENEYIASRARMLLEQIEKTGELPETYPYPVQLWQLGDDADFAILGGEVVVDYSIRLKTEWPETPLWVAGYSNDVMAYIPSRRVLKEGGYEGASSMIYYGLPTVWAPEIEDMIIKTLLDFKKPN